MENKEEKKTISDQPKIDKKRLGKVIIFLLFFGFLLIFISNYFYGLQKINNQNYHFEENFKINK